MSRQQRSAYFFIPKVALALVGVGLNSPVALASHTEGLLEAGEGLTVSPLGLALGGFLSFLVLGSAIVLGLRYLRHLGEGSKSSKEKT